MSTQPPEGTAAARADGRGIVFGRDTELSLNDNCATWLVPADYRPEGTPMIKVDHRGIPMATLRRIGWLDQKGRVWTHVPSGRDFDGGSLTPLLIDVRGDD